MNFWERLINWFQYKYYDLKRHYWMFPILEKMSEEFFGIVEPRIEELDTRLSLVLVNDHFTMTQPTPLAPSVIPVAGLHIKPVKPLPKVGKNRRHPHPSPQKRIAEPHFFPQLLYFKLKNSWKTIFRKAKT